MTMPTIMPLTRVTSSMSRSQSRPSCQPHATGNPWKAAPRRVISARTPMSDKPEDDKLETTRPKLVAAKERWAREGRLLTGGARPESERLPPGQHRVRDWPVLDLGILPAIATASWRLTVDG